MLLELDQLVERAGYCVIRDESNRESILVTGRKIRAEALSSSDFRRFKPFEPMTLPGYVRVRIDDEHHLGIWHDPTRPELQNADLDQTVPFQVSVVNAVPLPPKHKAPSIRDILAGCTDLLTLCSQQTN